MLKSMQLESNKRSKTSKSSRTSSKAQTKAERKAKKNEKERGKEKEKVVALEQATKSTLSSSECLTHLGNSSSISSSSLSPSPTINYGVSYEASKLIHCCFMCRISFDCPAYRHHGQFLLKCDCRALEKETTLYFCNKQCYEKCNNDNPHSSNNNNTTTDNVKEPDRQQLFELAKLMATRIKSQKEKKEKEGEKDKMR